MGSKGIVRKHVVTEKIPLIAAAVLMLVAQYLPNFAVSAAIEPLYEKLGQPDILLRMYGVFVILVALLLVLIFERWFYPEYESSLKLKGFGRGMLVALPVILFVFAWLAFRLAMGFATFYGVTAGTAIQGLRAGMNEEAAFRAIAVALLLRQFRNERNIWVPAVFTGAFFGCTHLLNLLSGDELLNTAVNTVFAASFGIIFGIIFTLSGNFWPVVILHSLYDTMAFCVEGAEDAPDWPVYCEVGVILIGAVIYLVVLHRMRGRASALWEKKWNYRTAGAAGGPDAVDASDNVDTAGAADVPVVADTADTAGAADIPGVSDTVAAAGSDVPEGTGLCTEAERNTEDGRE